MAKHPASRAVKSKGRPGPQQQPPAPKNAGDFVAGFQFDLGGLQEPVQAPWEFKGRPTRRLLYDQVGQPSRPVGHSGLV